MHPLNPVIIVSLLNPAALFTCPPDFLHWAPDVNHPTTQLQVQLGHNPQLEQVFGCEGPFWGRQYFFWHKGTPLTLIHEVFSNNLQNRLQHPDITESC